MKNAINAMRDGSMTKNKAAFHQNIPKGTLSSRLNGKYKTNQPGAPTILSAKSEFLLFTKIIFFFQLALHVRQLFDVQQVNVIVIVHTLQLINNNELILRSIQDIITNSTQEAALNMTNSILSLIQTKCDKAKTATEKASGRNVALKYNTDYMMSTENSFKALQ